MRNGLGCFSESVCDARSDRNRDGNVPEQRMLWYGTAATSRAAVRVEVDTTSMKPDQDAKIDFGAPAILRKWPSVNKEHVSALARVLTRSSQGRSASAFESFCRSRYRGNICMKFTPRRNLIWQRGFVGGPRR
jgi:hypothetical protein